MINSSASLDMCIEQTDTEYKKLNAHPVIKWSIIIFSLQNVLFYFYWEPLFNFINHSIILWTS